MTDVGRPAAEAGHLAGLLLVTTLGTPDGPFTVVEETDGTVWASGWSADVGDLLHRAHIAPGTPLAPSRGTSAAVRAVLSLYEGDAAPLAGVPVRRSGTAFQQEVWRKLRDIPVGTTLSYGRLGECIGRPRAVRAVGLACGRNAVAPFVPCHRVVGADGSLTGYAWGLEVKRHLLTLEGALRP